MHFLTLLAIAVPALVAADLEDNYSSIGLPDSYEWNVEEWIAGCQKSGCIYSFKVSGEQYGGDLPAFIAECNGWDANYFMPCDIRNVTDEGAPASISAKLSRAQGTGGPIVALSLAVQERSGATANYTGDAPARFNEWISPAETFSIKPEQVQKTF